MEHKNVLILLAVLAVGVGLFYWYGGKDGGTFLPLDTPSVVEDAAEEADESPASPVVSPAPVPPAPDRVVENGVVVHLIYLTNLGFTPYEVTVNSGEEVRFINKTDGAMRIGSDSTKSNQYYSGVTQPDVVGKGGTYQIGLVSKGLWNYENLVNPRAKGATGVIYVR